MQLRGGSVCFTGQFITAESHNDKSLKQLVTSYPQLRGERNKYMHMWLAHLLACGQLNFYILKKFGTLCLGNSVSYNGLVLSRSINLTKAILYRHVHRSIQHRQHIIELLFPGDLDCVKLPSVASHYAT